jgi:hypothetical protein
VKAASMNTMTGNHWTGSVSPSTETR